MRYIIDITLKKGYRDRHGEHINHDIKDAGIASVKEVSYFPVYSIEGELTGAEIAAIATKLLIDPITEEYRVNRKLSSGKSSHEVEVWLKHGVTDTVADSVIKAVRDLGINKEFSVKTGQRYLLKGNITKGTLMQIAQRLLMNPMIQSCVVK